MNFINYASNIWLPDCPRLILNWKNNNDVTISWHYVIVKLLSFCRVSLVNFGYRSMFHIYSITLSRVMGIFICKALIRNPKIGNIHIWAFSNTWRLGWLSDTILGTNVFNNMLLKAVNAWVAASIVSGLLKENQPNMVDKIALSPAHNQIRFKRASTE